MDGFYRRGDVWWARLAVPARLRQAAGRREFVQSCRTTDKHAGRVVAAALLAQWRRHLFELEGGRVDIEKLVGGGPALVAGGKAASLDEGIRVAQASIDSGAALNKLEELIRKTHDS